MFPLEETVRELIVVAFGLILAEGIKYLAVKIFKKIDAAHHTWFDSE